MLDEKISFHPISDIDTAYSAASAVKKHEEKRLLKAQQDLQRAEILEKEKKTLLQQAEFALKEAREERREKNLSADLAARSAQASQDLYREVLSGAKEEFVPVGWYVQVAAEDRSELARHRLETLLRKGRSAKTYLKNVKGRITTG